MWKGRHIWKQKHQMITLGESHPLDILYCAFMYDVRKYFSHLAIVNHIYDMHEEMEKRDMKTRTNFQLKFQLFTTKSPSFLPNLVRPTPIRLEFYHNFFFQEHRQKMLISMMSERFKCSMAKLMLQMQWKSKDIWSWSMFYIPYNVQWLNMHILVLVWKKLNQSAGPNKKIWGEIK